MTSDNTVMGTECLWWCQELAWKDSQHIEAVTQICIQTKRVLDLKEKVNVQQDSEEDKEALIIFPIYD